MAYALLLHGLVARQQSDLAIHLPQSVYLLTPPTVLHLHYPSLAGAPSTSLTVRWFGSHAGHPPPAARLLSSPGTSYVEPHIKLI